MFYYSKTTNAFYLADSIENYMAAGTWPDDANEIDTEIAHVFMQAPPSGQCRIAGKDGLPAWGDIPPPTAEEQAITAGMQQQSLLSRASREIQWRQDAVDADIVTEKELNELKEWKHYRVLLMRVDIEIEDIAWPKLPE
ncbi:tail fiber assembly protein [Escherichia coli]|nr:tail fiber assembly protein [Escherichia coli]